MTGVEEQVARRRDPGRHPMIAAKLALALDVVEPAARIAQRLGVPHADRALAIAARVRESLPDLRAIEAAVRTPAVSA